jgi:hypothetical protein
MELENGRFVRRRGEPSRLKGRQRRTWRGFSDHECVRRFMRHRRHIRGSREWQEPPVEGDRRQALDIFPMELPSIDGRRHGYGGDVDDWIEEFELAVGDEELDEELSTIFGMLDRTYYQILDYKLLSQYEEVFLGSLTRHLRTLKKTQAATKRTRSSIESGDPSTSAYGRAQITASSLEDDHEDLGEDAELGVLERVVENPAPDMDDVDDLSDIIEAVAGDSLLGAYHLGMIGGFSPTALRRGLENRGLHSLPCFRSLIIDLSGVFDRLGIDQSRHCRLTDQLLVSYFRTWYHTKVDARRVRRILRPSLAPSAT